MKLKILIILILILLSCNNKKYRVHNEIKHYVEFLKDENTSAKDYILSQFTNHDVVIIAERDHRELTQYDLFLEIIKDQWFIDNVGNVFIEVCTRSQSRNIDSLLLSTNLNNKVADSLIMQINRNNSVHPVWTRYNFPYLLKKLRNINNTLDNEKKIHLFPSDVAINWKNMDSIKYKQFWSSIETRDQKIAEYIIDKFDSIRSANTTRKKALVIMNYRHAFGNKFMYANGEKPENVGRYLFERYGNKTKNILLNTVTWDSEDNVIPINNGKWDASFRIANIDNLGFDFNKSPFGQDHFDLWPWTEHDYTYQDVFNGFAFYKPINEFKMTVGVPNLVDKDFLYELKRRNTLVNNARGANFPLEDSILLKYNDKTIYNRFSDSLFIEIDKWLD